MWRVCTLISKASNTYNHVSIPSKITRPFSLWLTCLREILKAGASRERSKSTGPATEFRPRVTEREVITNSTTFPFRTAKTPGPNSADRHQTHSTFFTLPYRALYSVAFCLSNGKVPSHFYPQTRQTDTKSTAHLSHCWDLNCILSGSISLGQGKPAFLHISTRVLYFVLLICWHEAFVYT